MPADWLGRIAGSTGWVDWLGSAAWVGFRGCGEKLSAVSLDDGSGICYIRWGRSQFCSPRRSESLALFSPGGLVLRQLPA